MKNNLVGTRFSPTGEELINYYLKNKILGRTWLVDDAISEINISSHDPIYLPSYAQIKSNDHVWYFFSRKEFTYATKKVINTTTPSGFWKPTGVDRKIKDRRGTGVEIGIKKTLVYHEGKFSNGVRTPWVMHEYRITCLPLVDQRTYVICQIMYKGEPGDLPYSGNGEDGDFLSVGNNSSELRHSLVSDLTTVSATTLTDIDNLQQDLPTVQRPVVDSKAVRAATFAKMHKLLQILPSVERHGKLTSHGSP